MRFFTKRSDENQRLCPATSLEHDGTWRCGKSAGHSNVHQAKKRGSWYAIYWSDSDEELDRYFGIPVE